MLQLLCLAQHDPAMRRNGFQLRLLCSTLLSFASCRLAAAPLWSDESAHDPAFGRSIIALRWKRRSRLWKNCVSSVSAFSGFRLFPSQRSRKFSRFHFVSLSSPRKPTSESTTYQLPEPSLNDALNEQKSRMANFVVILLVSFMLLALAQALGGGGMPGGGMPGGWSFVDPRDERVQSAARFAVTTKYPDRAPQFIVVMARKQVILSC